MVQATPSANNTSRRYVKSSSFIMAMLFTVLCGAAATALGFFINYFTKGHFVHSTETVLDTQIAFVDALGIDRARMETNGQYVLLADDGSLPTHIKSDLDVLTEGIIVYDDTALEKRFAAKVHSLRDGHQLLVATDITDVSDDFAFMQVMGLVSIFFVMLVVFVSYLISFFVVSGTNHIADTAREIIDTGDLTRRITVHSGWDDLSNMANVLNLLLDRIEVLMQGVKQVSDNIAHDLRRPLTRLRNHVDSLEHSKDHDELLTEVDQLMSTFNALLRISRIEQEKQRSRFATTDVGQIIRDVVELYEPVAEANRVRIETALVNHAINGDRDLLFQAFANIIDNAIKFTPDDSIIRITMLEEDSSLTITVEDEGDGVSETELNYIFQRFYRADASRNTAGNGLGLALVKAVIELHEGTVFATRGERGLKIITIL